LRFSTSVGVAGRPSALGDFATTWLITGSDYIRTDEPMRYAEENKDVGYIERRNVFDKKWNAI
jgi:hypothetical protein